MNRRARVRAGVSLLLVLLSVGWLADVPAVWFDEGSHLHVPQLLVERGIYADYSDGELRYGGPVAGVGPTVLVPIAASFRLFGVGLLQGRGVMVAFLLLFLITTWRFARGLASERVADITILLLVGAPAVNVLLIGRQVLGEVPALWFVMLGLIAWQRALPGDRLVWYAASGLAFGLAAVTKYQFLIMLVPGLCLAWAVTQWRGAWVSHRAFLVPLVVCGVVFAAWQGALLLYFGMDVFVSNILGISAASKGAAVTLSPERIRESLRVVLGAGAYVGLAVPALIWVGARALATRNERSAVWLLIVALAAANLAWFVASSIGWQRYALPGLALAGLAAAAMLDYFVSSGLGQVGDLPASALRVVGWAWIGLAGPLPLALTANTILHPPANDARAMATFVDATVPPAALIETWEPHLSVLSGHRFRFPPNTLLRTAVAYRFAGGPPPSSEYDFTTPSPDYVLVGDFGTWVDVYPSERLKDGFDLLHEEGSYKLYQRRSAPAGEHRE